MMIENSIEYVLDVFRKGGELPSSISEPFLDAMIGATDESRLVKIFSAWDEKGITENEIYSLAKIMRHRCKKVSSRHDTFVDIVGTGGGKVKTFNVSTAAAFVVAGAGVAVAKHGNRAATSRSGSADALSALGVEPATDAETAERCLNEIGICFMYAPNFHRLSSTLANVRRRLGFPTIFNCIGPLCNPANAPHQLIGVWDRSLVGKMAKALARLGTKRSWIVHGEDGSDEISISGRTFVAEIENGRVRDFEITPSDLGVSPSLTAGLSAGTPAESAAIIRELLEGKGRGSASETLLLANASAAIYLAGHADDPRQALKLAIDSIHSGNALKKLNAFSATISR